MVYTGSESKEKREKIGHEDRFIEGVGVEKIDFTSPWETSGTC